MYTKKPAEFFKKAIGCARHYGFYTAHEWSHRAAQNPALARTPKEKKPTFVVNALHRKIDPTTRELESALHGLSRAGIAPGDTPILLYSSNLTSRPGRSLSFSLHVLGMKHSMAEALVLKTAMAILEDLGVNDTCTYINSIGCKDSSAKFSREATALLRRILDSAPPSVAQHLKEDLFLAYRHIAHKKIQLSEELPRPMEYLSSISRKHLREVLEFLEAADLPYSFDDMLINHRDCYQHTLFEVRSGDPMFSEEPDAPQHMYARGGRYDELARQVFKQPTSAVGITFTLAHSPANTDPLPEFVPKQIKKPRVYFIRLGYAAELKSFFIIEALRKARVPLTQSFGQLRLSDHIAYAENLSIPFTLIMGQKEALENSVIIRDTATRAQQTVPINNLHTFFKQTV
jgi:histidyl-tRNA synthetase